MIIERTVTDQRLRLECSETYARAAANVLEVFEKLAGSGASLKPGYQMRFGWSLLRLQEDGPTLRVTEPEFARWPEQHWASTLDTTLSILVAQTRLLQHLKLEGEDAFFDQAVIAAPGAFAQYQVFLRRASRASGQDSGWLLGDLNHPEALTHSKSLEAVLIAGLVARRPALLQALAFPSGFVAIFSGDELEQVLDAAGRTRLTHPLSGGNN